MKRISCRKFIPLFLILLLFLCSCNAPGPAPNGAPQGSYSGQIRTNLGDINITLIFDGDIVSHGALSTHYTMENEHILLDTPIITSDIRFDIAANTIHLDTEQGHSTLEPSRQPALLQMLNARMGIIIALGVICLGMIIVTRMSRRNPLIWIIAFICIFALASLVSILNLFIR